MVANLGICIPWPEQVIVQLVPDRTRAQSGALAHLRNYKHSVKQTLSDEVKQGVASPARRTVWTKKTPGLTQRPGAAGYLPTGTGYGGVGATRLAWIDMGSG